MGQKIKCKMMNPETNRIKTYFFTQKEIMDDLVFVKRYLFPKSSAQFAYKKLSDSNFNIKNDIWQTFLKTND